jgi:hypothetical protein
MIKNVVIRTSSELFSIRLNNLNESLFLHLRLYNISPGVVPYWLSGRNRNKPDTEVSIYNVIRSELSPCYRPSDTIHKLIRACCNWSFVSLQVKMPIDALHISKHLAAIIFTTQWLLVLLTICVYENCLSQRSKILMLFPSFIWCYVLPPHNLEGGLLDRI